MYPLIPAHPVDNRADIITPGGFDYMDSALFHLYFLESYETPMASLKSPSCGRVKIPQPEATEQVF
jgi:hypothetical protein